MSAFHFRVVTSEFESWVQALLSSKNYVDYSNMQPGWRIIVLYQKHKKQTQTNK